MEKPRRQRGLGLIGHVLLAAEGAAVRDEFHADAVAIDAEHRRDLVAVVPDALAARVDVQPTVGAGHGQGGLRFEESVLDSLRLEHLADHVGAGGQAGVHVAPGVGRAREHVAVGPPYSHLRRRHGRQWAGQRLQWRVGHVDQLRRRPGRLARLGHHHGQHVSGVGGTAAGRDHDGPVPMDDADPKVSRDVGGGEDGDHAGCSSCPVGVDADDVGSGVVRKPEGGVQEARRAEVVDITAVAERQCLGLVPGPPAADTAGPRRLEVLSGGHLADSVEDFYVPRTAAQVGT